MRYEAPESLEGAVALLAGATGEARVLAGGTDLLVQMRADVVDPELIVDIKKIPETRAVTEEKGGWRIGAAVTGAELKEHPRLKQVVAGRGRGRQPHRLDPGAGPRHPGRQPLQRLAGGRQRARAHRGRRRRHAGRAAGPARPAGRGRHARAPQAGAAQGRDRRLVPAAAAAAALERRVPALHPAHRDGHRGGRRGREPDGRRRPARSRRRACRWARWPRGCCWWRRRPRPSSGSRLDRPAQERLEAAARAACRPIDDKRGTIEFRIQVAGVLARRAALIALDRARTS